MYRRTNIKCFVKLDNTQLITTANKFLVFKKTFFCHPFLHLPHIHFFQILLIEKNQHTFLKRFEMDYQQVSAVLYCDFIHFDNIFFFKICSCPLWFESVHHFSFNFRFVKISAYFLFHCLRLMKFKNCNLQEPTLKQLARFTLHQWTKVQKKTIWSVHMNCKKARW